MFLLCSYRLLNVSSNIDIVFFLLFFIFIIFYVTSSTYNFERHPRTMHNTRNFLCYVIVSLFVSLSSVMMKMCFHCVSVHITWISFISSHAYAVYLLPSPSLCRALAGTWHLWLCSFKGSKDAGLNQRRTRYLKTASSFILKSDLFFFCVFIFYWWWKTKKIFNSNIYLIFVFFFFSFFIVKYYLSCLMPAFIITFFVIMKKKNKKISCLAFIRLPSCEFLWNSRISPMRDGQTPERDRLPHYGPRFSDR